MFQHSLYNASKNKQRFVRLSFKDATNHQQKKTIKVFLVDDSGSMDSYSRKVLDFINSAAKKGYIYIRFSSTAELFVIGENPITKIEGKSTDIEAGAKLLCEFINSHKEDIDVIFISDGADNNPSTISDRIRRLVKTSKYTINFYCVGVGNGFPTNLAMQFRSVFHNGGADLQSVFLIHSPSDIESVLGNVIERCIPRPTFNLPRDAYFLGENIGKTVFDGQWFQYYGDIESWARNNNAIVSYELDETFAEQAANRVREADISGMDRKKVQEMAASVFEMIHTLEIQTNREAKTFYQKIKKLRGDNVFAIWKQIVKEIRDGQYLKGLSDVQLAARLNIGSQTGKYNNRMAKKNKAVDISKIKKEFLEVFRRIKGEIAGSGVESILSCQSMIDIFDEPNFAAAIEQIESLEEFISIFPLVGLGVFSENTDASMINPYLMVIKTLGNTELRFVDSQSIFEQKEGIEVQSSTVVFNKVLFVLTPEMKSIVPLMKTELMQAVLSFQATRSPDVVDFEAHMAMLIIAYESLTKTPKSQYRDDMMSLIKNTFEMLYIDRKAVKEFLKALETDGDFNVLITSSTHSDIKCQHLSKFKFLRLFVNLSEKRNEELDQMFKIEEQRRLYESAQSIDKLFTVRGKTHIFDSIDKVSYNWSSIDEFCTHLKDLVTDVCKIGDPEITSKIGLTLWETFHIWRNNNSHACMTTPITFNYDDLVKEICGFYRKQSIEQELEKVFAQHEPEFKRQFIEKHQGVPKPVTPKELEQKFGKDAKYNPQNGLSLNTCMLCGCQKNFSGHILTMKKYFHEEFTDCLHKASKADCNESVDYVYLGLIKGDYADKDKEWHVAGDEKMLKKVLGDLMGQFKTF